MIITVNELKKNEKFDAYPDDVLEAKLKAIEQSIRSYTHNNFQNRMVRNNLPSKDGVLVGEVLYLSVGDTVQISKSINKGLYTVAEIANDTIACDESLFDSGKNLVTKVEYPADVVEGVKNMMLWEVDGRAKVGVKQESLSRHSVTYFDMDTNSTVGYPSSLLGFLVPYMRANI
ncbi:hypothetical protein LJC20_00480 [Eubacteriales bacterium OttesenSCG-928-M02]|nr:hypothetical protein [Eubacteriales bacterium OttesenSCG-928-M02]